jgi:3-oxoacyl-[acyl-carrier protein] reductase
MKLGGKTALVTGASRGIGRQIAQSLASEGARVGIVARSADGLEETRRLVRSQNTSVFCADLRDSSAITALGNAVHCTLGDVDILVNAAGVWHDQNIRYQGPRLAETPVQQINDVLEVGLRAPFLLTKLLLTGMIRRRAGKVLQIGCGFAGPHEAIGWLHYYVTNKAIEAFTAGLAAELREYGVQVNCIAPWFVATEPVRQFFPDDFQKALNPDEVAKLTTFLVSADSDHISGQTIQIRSNLDAG